MSALRTPVRSNQRRLPPASFLYFQFTNIDQIEIAYCHTRQYQAIHVFSLRLASKSSLVYSGIYRYANRDDLSRRR